MSKFLDTFKSKPTDAVVAGFFLIMTLAMVGFGAALGAAAMAFVAGIYWQRFDQAQQKL